MKTWKQKIGKRLLKHVKKTTARCTLGEVKNNIRAIRAQDIYCPECMRIAYKLGIK